MLIRYHERVGHLFVPNLRARIPNEVGGYFVVTNSLGFRSDYEFEKKKTRRPRILMFGDSYTAGDDCPNQDRYSDVLARILDCEVYNFGVSGSGTDQHLLIRREFADEIEADLVKICVQIDSIHRIQLSHRESQDRVTGRRVLVPNPYFELVDGKLELRQCPVPRERPEVGALPETPDSARDWRSKVVRWYRDSNAAESVRGVMGGALKPVRSAIFRLAGAQPYPDFESQDTPGWRLMSAILEQFIEEVKPLPVLIVPIPTHEYFRHGLDPVYQKFFETLEDRTRGVYVSDISRPMISLPQEARQKLGFKIGAHFTPFANEMAAGIMAETIRAHKLLPSASLPTPPRPEPVPHKPRISSQSTYILGLSCFYHNSAAALLRDGEIVAAAEEERFSRVKNDRRFPRYAANYVLEEAGVNPRDLKGVVFYDNTALTFERLLHSQLALGPAASEMWLHAMPTWVKYKLRMGRLIRGYLHYDGPVYQDLHHRSHAASAFYPSPFDRAAILTVDGVGEWATASIGAGQGNQLRLLREMRFPNSLGLLYSAFTQFTGFKVNSGEYKMMGLAPYGEPKYADRILSELVDLKEDGSLELNMQYFGFLEKPEMTNARFAELFAGPARKPDSRITRREMDLARSIQSVTEEALLRMARHAHSLTGEKNLCLAGGVALNCVANGRILREGPFANLWIQPAAGDSGGALGAAFDLYYTHFQNPRVLRADGQPAQAGSLLGPQFSDDEIRSYLDTHGYVYREMAAGERLNFLADALQDGKVVGHFSGRLEYGPRALGARSILGDARNRTMQTDLNLKIKYRESFRPFAPAVLAERVSDYFDLDRESPYMLIVAPVRQDRRAADPHSDPASGDDLLPVVRQVRSDIPAVTHIDYSARIQTVHQSFHKQFYDLIRRFEQKTGCGLVVNTSFNVRGEPIVCSPADGYRCFMRTEMNILSLGRFILLKEEQPPWPEAKGEGLESEDLSEIHSVSSSQDDSGKLARIFRDLAVPLAARLRDAGRLPMELAFRASKSTWKPLQDRPSSLFEMPAALVEDDADPGAVADALMSSWDGAAQDRGLRELLVALAALGEERNRADVLQEEVPDSVYVMF